MSSLGSCSECEFLKRNVDEWPCRECTYNGGTYELFTLKGRGRCVKCGALTAEGRHVCLACEAQNDMQTFKEQRGKWLVHRETVKYVDGSIENRPAGTTCSLCGGNGNISFKFCPHCGKPMEGGSNE